MTWQCLVGLLYVLYHVVFESIICVTAVCVSLPVPRGKNFIWSCLKGLVLLLPSLPWNLPLSWPSWKPQPGVKRRPPPQLSLLPLGEYLPVIVVYMCKALTPPSQPRIQFLNLLSIATFKGIILSCSSR